MKNKDLLENIYNFEKWGYIYK